MLIRFVVSNYLSFDEETEFSMIAGSFKTHKHHVYSAGKIDALKTGVLYGANGAGKSNLIESIDFFQETIKKYPGKISDGNSLHRKQNFLVLSLSRSTSFLNV